MSAPAQAAAARTDGPGGVAAIVPAAGQSSRFGSMKLVAPVGDEPLIDRTLASLIDAGIATVIVVVSPGADLGVAQRLRDARVHVVVNPDPARGMFSSIQAGLAAAAGSNTVLVLPADMPFVLPKTIRAVADECVRTNRSVVAAYNGRRGHPLALPGALLSALLSATPTGSLKDALAPLALDTIHVDVDDAGVLRDVDVPADLV